MNSTVDIPLTKAFCTKADKYLMMVLMNYKADHKIDLIQFPFEQAHKQYKRIDKVFRSGR